jgi:hypothetical protein
VIECFVNTLDTDTICAFSQNYHTWLVNDAKLILTEEHIITIPAKHVCNANQLKKWMSDLTYLIFCIFITLLHI